MDIHKSFNRTNHFYLFDMLDFHMRLETNGFIAKTFKTINLETGVVRVTSQQVLCLVDIC